MFLGFSVVSEDTVKGQMISSEHKLQVPHLQILIYL